MTRIFDILFSFFGLVLLSPILIVLVIIGYFDTGSPIFRQERVGKGKQPFRLMKFRSMNVNAPSVATHLASASSITPYGSFLRKSKLDELPQLWNVFVGDMSLVGPRPNLFNQEELIYERDSRGVYSVRPGITGLAQINKIDMSTPQLLAETDSKMIQELNTFGYFKYIFLTVFGKGFGDRIKKDAGKASPSAGS
ncbi:MAG: sugar transferase [Chitinophagaceae bacterium]|nr:sugar transferase [Chitinophagaceae bacterium]